MNPFKDYGDIKADYDRYLITLKKLPAKLTGEALDLGVVNPFTPILQEKYPDLKIINTAAELDFDSHALPYPDRSFDAIFSFEVLEHLMNPLWSLRECRRVLRDSGTIYVTTPKGGFPSTLMWPDTHFHEIDHKRLQVLAKSAGLRIDRIERFNKGPWYWWKMGIFRPTVRVFFGGWFYIEMKKEINN
ncbi:MAG: methyltransferase domain-containing protein [candidate division KSB1 bacterium]|nr:methyltransferase domain-containing protein [candidate division KSB1 bacterium]